MNERAHLERVAVMRGPKRQIGAILALLVFVTFQGAPARAYEELITQLPRRGNWARAQTA